MDDKQEWDSLAGVSKRLIATGCAATFFHEPQFGGWLILGLIVDTLLHVIPFPANLVACYRSSM
jgi:hypothetical protein